MFGLINVENTRKDVIDALSETSSILFAKGDTVSRRRINTLLNDLVSVKLKRRQAKKLKAITLEICKEAGRSVPSTVKIKSNIDKIYKVISRGKSIEITIEDDPNTQKALEQVESIKEKINSYEQELKTYEAKLNNPVRKLSRVEFKETFLQVKRIKTKLASLNRTYDNYLVANDNIFNAETIRETREASEDIQTLTDAIDITKLKEDSAKVDQIEEDVHKTASEIDEIQSNSSLNTNESFEMEYERYLEGRAVERLEKDSSKAKTSEKTKPSKSVKNVD